MHAQQYQVRSFGQHELRAHKTGVRAPLHVSRAAAVVVHGHYVDLAAVAAIHCGAVAEEIIKPALTANKLSACKLHRPSLLAKCKILQTAATSTSALTFRTKLGLHT